MLRLDVVWLHFPENNIYLCAILSVVLSGFGGQFMEVTTVKELFAKYVEVGTYLNIVDEVFIGLPDLRLSKSAIAQSHSSTVWLSECIG
jgi:hypothetical protein